MNLKLIPLTRGMYAKVSDRDYNWLQQYKWRALKGTKTYYAVRHDHSSADGRDHIVFMHREILGLTLGDGILGDHRDCDGLNNQRRNLRRATVCQNQQNQRMFRNKSGFKGVKKSNLCEGWSARIKKDGREIYLGFYDSPEKAHAAYCKAAKKLFGQFARAV